MFDYNAAADSCCMELSPASSNLDFPKCTTEMQPFELIEHPLFVWAKSCCELPGIKEILANLERLPIDRALLQPAAPAEFCANGDRRPLFHDDGSHQQNGDSQLKRSSLEEPDGDSCSLTLWPAASLTYSDLCAGLLLYACITYIDSKDRGDAAELETLAKQDPPSVVEECESVGVLDTNHIHYVRLRSSPTTRLGELTEEKALPKLHCADDIVTRNGDDVAYRLRNLRAVMRRIQSFYAEALNALIVMPLPDLLLIARSPFPEESGEEMKKVLLLLLGCAVQSDKKEEFIRKIKELDLGLQQAIVEQIKRVTDTVDCVLNVQALELDPSDRTTATVLHQLQRVIKERDSFANSSLELAACSTNSTAVVASEHESDGGSTSSSTIGGGAASGGHHSSSSSSSVCNGDVCQRKLPESQQDAREHSSERHHLAVELADVKAKFRRARQELEEKIELASEYKEELAEKESALAKLRQENLDLLKDARAAKEYRDELDVLREKVDRLERLEHECGKYKERLTELDFYKSRVEELREENHLLLESKHMFESQVDSLNSRIQKGASAETELLQAQRMIIDLQQELKSEREKLGDLLEQNIQLEKECQESLNQSSALEKELSDVKSALTNVGDADGHCSNAGSLSDQLNESAHAKLLRMELENQRLRSRLDETAPPSLVEQLKSENEKLRRRVEEQARNGQESSSQKDSLLKQRQELERNFRRSEEQYRREIDDLKIENTSLTDELSLTRDRYDDSLDEERKRIADQFDANTSVLMKERDELRLRKDEMGVENKRVAQEVSRCKTELARAQERILEHEKEKLAIENRLYVLDRGSRCSEKENAKLKQMLEAADEEFDKARAKILELEREKQKLDTAQAKLEKVEEAIVELEIEKRQFAQQAELEIKKCNALREDFIKEKTQAHDLKKSLHAVLHTLGIPTDAADGSLHKAESLIQDYSCSAKRETDELQYRIEELELRERQQNELLASQTSEIAALRQKVETRSDSNNEKLNHLERANAALLDENKNVKQQVYLLQEELRKMQNHGQATHNENGMLRREISELRLQMSSNVYAQSDNAKMQVELRSLQLQVDVLEQDNSELQKQCSQWERDHALVRRDFEHLQRQHGGLLQDHEQLQTLHEQLTSDFEKVQNELVQLKSQLRQLKHECAEHNDQLQRLTLEKERLANLQDRFEQEQFEKDREFKTFALLQNEHSAVKKNYDDLKARYDFLTNEMDHMRSDYRNLRMDYNAVNLKATQLQAQLTDSQDFAQRKDLESVKLMHKCDMMSQLNSTLEEESRTLLRQMDVLIAQNQGLLTRALMDKDQYHAESKEFQEKLNALRRHKEKLEEKIMEQYKAMDSPNKRQKEKLTFMKKAKALVSRPSTRKSRQQHLLNSGSAAEDSAMSADEGGFLSSSRVAECYQNPGQYGHRGVSRLRERAESMDSRRSEASSVVPQSHTPSEYADVIRSSPSCVSRTLQKTPLQQHYNRFRQPCSPLNSPEISHKRSHSSASTHGAESSLSSGTTVGSSGLSGEAPSNKAALAEKQEPPPLSTLPPFAPPSASICRQHCQNLIPDHVSLAGSERAVDVPPDYLSQQPPSHKGLNGAVGKPLPPYAPIRSSSQQSTISQNTTRESTSKPCQAILTSQPSTSPLSTVNRTKPRPPPPPYPGVITRKLPPPLPNSPDRPQQPSQLNRFRPDLAADDGAQGPGGNADPRPHPTSLNVLPACGESFEPAQTSTPKSDQPFLFDSMKDDNAVTVYPAHNPRAGSSSPHQFRLFCTTASNGFPTMEQNAAGACVETGVDGKYHSNPYRKTAAQSFYENIDDLQQMHSSETPEPDSAAEGNDAGVLDATATTVLPDSSPNGRDTNSIWYEYGCV